MRASKDDLLEAVLASRLGDRTVDVLSSAFDKQREFIRHPAKLKCLFCTRRAAKSYTAGLYLIDECLKNPGINTLFVCLTRLDAEGILLKDIVQVINKQFDLQLEVNYSKLQVRFPNGSILWLTGADTDAQEMNKLLGRKYKLVVIDEASMFRQDLRHMVYSILRPAMADLRGTICLMGTASNYVISLFNDITTGKEAGWQLFTWTAFDNPHIAKQWAEELEDIRTNRPLFMKTPMFRQMYLNEWVIDEDAKVYKYDQTLNSFAALPYYSIGKWQTVLGVDLGYEDDSSFCLVKFHEHDRNLYIQEVFKKKHMDITDVANKIKQYQTQYDMFKVVIDGSNKQAVEEMQRRHGIALSAAEKQGKSDFIQLMNADLIQGYIKLGPMAQPLADEYKALIWVTENNIIKEPRKEHPALPNHACDSALYAWRFCYPHLCTTAPRKINLKEQWAEHTKQLQEDHLEKQIQQQIAEENQNDIWAQMDSDPFGEGDPLRYALNKKRNK